MSPDQHKYIPLLIYYYVGPTYSFWSNKSESDGWWVTVSFELFWRLYTTWNVAQDLSGYQTYIGPVFEKGQVRFCHNMRQVRFCHDMRHYVDIVEKKSNRPMELRQFTCISMGAAFGVVRPVAMWARFSCIRFKLSLRVLNNQLPNKFKNEIKKAELSG